MDKNFEKFTLSVCNQLGRREIYHLKYSGCTFQLFRIYFGWHMTAAGLKCLLAQTCACRNGLIRTVYYTLITVFQFKRNPCMHSFSKRSFGKTIGVSNRLGPNQDHSELPADVKFVARRQETKQANVDPICPSGIMRQCGWWYPLEAG